MINSEFEEKKVCECMLAEKYHFLCAENKHEKENFLLKGEQFFFIFPFVKNKTTGYIGKWHTQQKCKLKLENVWKRRKIGSARTKINLCIC